MKVLYTAAHAGAPLHVPIGGGGAIARMLTEEWQRTRPFEFEVKQPVESAATIVAYSQREYTDFCYRFERETTNRILAEDPDHCRVLVNDISEGPDFAALARHGYKVFVIWHVDVLAFVTKMYFKDWISAPQAARWMRPFEKWLRGPARLVFTKQHQCVQHAAGHFVMTEAMKQNILACYPETDPGNIHVVPWGAAPPEGTGVREPSNVPVVLALSRISPEKGQHRLLEAMQGFPTPARVVVAGDAAFMGGAEYLARLRQMAAGLHGVEVRFPGHLSGQAKRDAFASADLYVFPSIAESYGLTLMEALGHGVPVVAWDHDGARAIVTPEFGVLVNSVEALRRAIASLLADPVRRARMGEAARAYAASMPFSKAAGQLASVLLRP